MFYLEVVLKLLAAFMLIMVYIHLSGKGALAPISSIDQVGNVVLGAIIGGMLYNHDVGMTVLLVVAGSWAGLQLLVRYISNRHMKVKDVVDGEAVRLMQNGRLLSANFADAKLSLRDFMMLLHQRGYRNLDSLKDVWYEYNGQLTVVEKGDDSLGVIVIENGEVKEDRLKRIDMTEAQLQDELKKQRIKLEDIFCAEWHHGKLWIYPVDREENTARA